MNKKFYVFLTAFVFACGALAATFVKTSSAAAQTAQLAAALPASDAVMTFDMRRLTQDALPQVLASKPQVLNSVNAKFDEVKNKLGIDLRQFEQVAVGISYKQISAAETDYQPVIMARGSFNAGAFLGGAKLAAQGKYREEKIGDRTIYIFSPQQLMQGSGNPQSPNQQKTGVFDRLMKSLTSEVALTNYDNNTLAIGTVARVKEALTGSSPRVSRELLDLTNRRPNQVMSFAANTPNGISQFYKLEIDEIGRNLDSIRRVYGALDYAAGNANFSAAARTTDADQAQSLEQMLTGLQMFGKVALGGAQGADKKVYARLIENARITRQTSEVTLDLQIPQTDVDALVGILIK